MLGMVYDEKTYTHKNYTLGRTLIFFVINKKNLTILSTIKFSILEFHLELFHSFLARLKKD